MAETLNILCCRMSQRHHIVHWNLVSLNFYWLAWRSWEHSNVCSLSFEGNIMSLPGTQCNMFSLQLEGLMSCKRNISTCCEHFVQDLMFIKSNPSQFEYSGDHWRLSSSKELGMHDIVQPCSAQVSCIHYVIRSYGCEMRGKREK